MNKSVSQQFQFFVYSKKHGRNLQLITGPQQ